VLTGAKTEDKQKTQNKENHNPFTHFCGTLNRFIRRSFLGKFFRQPAATLQRGTQKQLPPLPHGSYTTWARHTSKALGTTKCSGTPWHFHECLSCLESSLQVTSQVTGHQVKSHVKNLTKVTIQVMSQQL